MEYPKSKGDLGVDAMIGISLAILAIAAFLYVWTQGLPVENQTIPTP